MAILPFFSWKAMHFGIITRYLLRFASTEEQVTQSFKQLKCGSDHSIKAFFNLYLIIFKKEIYRCCNRLV